MVKYHNEKLLFHPTNLKFIICSKKYLCIPKNLYLLFYPTIIYENLLKKLNLLHK